MEGVNDATLQPVGNKMTHHDAVMCHGLIKRRYDATNRQHMIHDDAMYEPTGIKRRLDYLNRPTAAIVKDALHVIGLSTFPCLPVYK